MNHRTRRDGTRPFGSRVGILIKDNGDDTVGPPRATADDNTVGRSNIEGTFSGRAQDRLAGSGLGDGRVVGEEVASLDGSLRLPGKLHTEVPQICDRLSLGPLGIHQLQIVPVEINLVVDVRRGGGARKRGRRRGTGRQQLQSSKETQY